jgi:hypothetical protein
MAAYIVKVLPDQSNGTVYGYTCKPHVTKSGVKPLQHKNYKSNSLPLRGNIKIDTIKRKTITKISTSRGHAVALLVEGLCYKPESCGFESR